MVVVIQHTRPQLTINNGDDNDYDDETYMPTAHDIITVPKNMAYS